MRTLVALCSILMVAACARADEQAPEDTVHAFYAWALAHSAYGLPSPEQRSALADLLTPDTLGVLDAALRTEAECIAATSPGDKPFVLEGDLFVGNYEGATEVAYGESVRRGDTVRVEATLLYVDPRFPKADKRRALAWKNQLELRLAGERWYVYDVHFAEEQSLIGRLKAYIEEGARSCTGPRQAAQRLASCSHFAGELNGDGSDRDKEVASAMAELRCDTVDQDASAIREN